MEATVCSWLGDIGRDGRGVTEKSGGMAGNIGEEGYQRKCTVNRSRVICTREGARVGRFGEKTRGARLGWNGHVRRKEYGYIWRMMLRMELPGKRKR